MNELKSMLRELCSMATVSGHEKREKNRLVELAMPYFDEVREDSLGTFVFVKRAKVQNAPKMLLDAHFDEVGMMVSALCEGGFVSFVPIGGLDARVLPATEVTIYGKEKIYGLITSIPPHISGGKKKELPKIADMYIDTGYTLSRLEELVSAGDIIEFKDSLTELSNNHVASKSLDDKACVCAILDMARQIDDDKLQYDIYVTISAQEETGKNGARLVASTIKPDIALIADVNFASGEGIDETESIHIGKGAGVDISSLTDIRLTRSIMRILDSRGIPYQRICEPSRTSTNNDLISIVGGGVRTALFSIPLESMHTPSEVVSLNDIKSLSSILLEIAYTPKEEL